MSDGQDLFLDNIVDDGEESAEKRNDRQTDSRLGEDVVVRKDFDSPQLHHSQNELDDVPPRDSEEADKPVPPTEGEEAASDQVDGANTAAVDASDPAARQADGDSGASGEGQAAPTRSRSSSRRSDSSDPAPTELESGSTRASDTQSANTESEPLAASQRDSELVPEPEAAADDNGGGENAGSMADISVTGDTVDENSAAGTVVAKLDSVDVEGNSGGSVTYQIVDSSGNPVSDSNFEIIGDEIRVKAGADIDYEADPSHDLRVEVTDADGESYAEVITVSVNNLMDESPTDIDVSGGSVDENANQGIVVATLATVDADTGDTFTYRIVDGSGNPVSDSNFEIVGNEIRVKAGADIDYETNPSHDLRIEVTDAGGQSYIETVTVTVNDLNEHSAGAISDSDASANQVSENAAVGASVGVTALATDADGDAVSYSLDDDAGGLFTIDTNTGEVTVAGNLDYEAAQSHTITVRATSTDGSSSTADMAINVADVTSGDTDHAVGAISDSDVSANQVSENAAVGAGVGVTALATDADGETVTYSLDDDAGGLFTIDANTGEVSVAGNLDYETATSHTITVRATSADGSSSTADMAINVADVTSGDTDHAVGAISDSDASANQVSENAAVGASVGVTALATDADGETVTYSLDDDAGGMFTIDANTGEVTVAGNLDYETATSHTITVRATSADGSSSTADMTVNVDDVTSGDTDNTVGAVSDSDASANQVSENAAVGASVGVTALATDADGDAVTYSLDDDAGGLFSIDANTGEVTVAGNLDYETAQSHTITVRATSTDGSSSTGDMTVNVADVTSGDTDNAVGAVSDSDVSANQVSENASVGDSVGVTALATDVDGDAVTYSLDDDAGGMFTIDANTGEVTVAGNLDYETATSHTITVRATSADGSSSTADMAINVADVTSGDTDNAVGSVSDSDASANQVSENAVVGASVGVTALATDADGDAVTYSLDDDAGGMFTIDANTGEVTVAGNLDYETATSHTITVRATSTDGSISTADMTVNVADVTSGDTDNAVGAVSDSDASANQASENAAVGDSVGVTALATDADGDAVTYSLDDDAGGLFTIDANTGEVTVAGNLDYETATSHTITVRATSTDGSSSTTDMTVNVDDVTSGDTDNAVGAVSDSDASANQVSENASVGDSVGVTALATDADGDAVTYSLDDDAGGLFTIDANTGEVTVAGNLDYETAQSHTITVRATSTDGSSSTGDMTVNVADVTSGDTDNAVGAVSDSDASANQVSENANVGDSVGVTALATDADGDAVTYSLDDDAGGMFTIDANTGEVTVAGNLDYEAAASHTITVRATSADGSSSTGDMTVNVADVTSGDTDNAVGGVSDSDASANQVSENANVGDSVGVTALATDADGDAVTYSLDDDAGGMFTIDANTGEVTVAGNLDYETATSHTITVRATSTDGSSSTADMAINVSDVTSGDTDDAVGAVSDSDASANEVSENASVGASVGVTALATDADGDTVTYSLDDDAGGMFTIDANTGEVTVAGNLDYETAQSHTITVRASSTDGSSSTADMAINVSDVTSGDTDNAVGAVSDSDASANDVSENASVGDSVGVTALATDADGDAVTYSLDDDAGGMFTIDANTGEVTVAGNLDYETATSHTITVRATSADGSSSTADMAINVADVTNGDTDNAVGAVSDSDASANQVSENAAVGDSVGVTALATDADGDAVTYSLDDDAGGRFTIDANTGEVTVAGNLDYESATSHTITVRATSADGSSSTADMAINVADVTSGDTDDAVGAVSDSDASANQVSENASVGASVGVTALATDADGDTVTYSLDDNAGGMFTIDANTGEVTVAGNLDYETATSHTITVRATSTDGSSSTADMAINVADVTSGDTDNAVGAVSDSDASANQVSENASVGDSVGVTALATDADGDAVTYSLDDDAGGMFTIDANTGEVTVAGNLDYETATSHTITVRATSTDGSSSTADMAINVADVTSGDTDNAVGAVSDSDASANQVSENASVGDSVGVTALATDADGDAVTYSLDDDAGGMFTIDANTGEVTVAGNLDYETATSHTITVRATSTDGSSSTADMAINVADVTSGDTDNAVGAVSDSDASANQVSENASVGDSVGVTALATDADGDAVTYSLDDDAGGMFTIDANTGEVTVAGNLDYETATSHTITVRATSTDGSSSTADMAINVADVTSGDTDNAVGAVSDSDASANQVSENASVGDSVGVTALATDADGDTVTYSLDDDAGGLFTIDANTGEVTVAGNLDYETAQSHTITVRATSTDGSSSTGDMTVNVADVTSGDTDNAVGSVSDSDASANQVSENASVGDSVGVTALATDADGDAVTYSLDDDAGGMFTIDANTGEVTVAGNLDYETATSHTITVRATSTDGSSSTADMAINVADVTNGDTDNAVGAVSDSDASDNQVSENAAVGDSVGVTALATDADGDAVTYSLDDDAGGMFTIDANTGEVTVAGNLDYETATSHTITVRATSTDGSSSTADMAINVADVTSGDTDNAVGAVSDSDASANQVSENASVGDSVGVTALATDADGDAVTYSLDDDAGGMFTIDANTGEVTVAGNLDYETATSHTITVRATSTDGSSSTADMTVNVDDVTSGDIDNAVGAVSDSDASANQVSENANVGDSVGVTALATDADGDAVTYSLDDDAGGMFTIDANTGEVTVAGNLDYETATSHTITVRATSTDGSSSTADMAINVADVTNGDTDNAVGAVSDSDASANQVSENASVGDSVGVTALATDADGDAVTYSLDDDAGGMFTIDANTGEVTVAGNLDYETATSHTITVRATSTDGSSSTADMTVNVADVTSGDTDNAVGAVSDSDASANQVSENASVGDSVGVTALATDADGDAVTYSLDDDAGGMFTIDANTGEVTVAGNLDYETATSHTITVRATSTDGSSSTADMTVNVDDVTSGDTDNAVGAVSDSDASANQVSENANVGDSVGVTALATDADGDVVTYSLDDDAGGMFTIDANTGEVTVAGNLDYETATSHTITVRATSTDGSSSTADMTVNVADVTSGDTDNAVGAVSDSDASANQVSENASIGDSVGVTALATDADGDAVTYSLDDDAGGMFTIDANTGEVTVAGNLDYETATSHTITVRATSTDGSSSTADMTVNVDDVTSGDTDNAVGAVSDSDASANQVSENAAVGDSVGVTALATDADGDTVTYSLDDDAGGMFTIDANTGEVTVAGNLDYETATSHTITVRATSTDGSSSTVDMAINVADVTNGDTDNAVGAVSDSDASANQVSENANVGDSVGVTALATDADGDAVTYSLDDDAGGMFTIDANTGEVTVAGNLDYETATSHTITVRATSTDGSISTADMTVNVADVTSGDTDNAVGAVSDSDASANQASENAAVGDSVGVTALATDADGDAVTYSLDDDAGGLFTIDANTGEVTVAGNLDYETATSHTITVRATSTDGSSSTVDMAINVADVTNGDTDNAVGAVSDSDASANQVSENANVGDSVGVTALATDADGDAVTYSLDDDAGGMFTIDANTGEVTVAGNLDYETATSHTITVRATSTDGSSSTTDMTVNVDDVTSGDTDNAVGAVSDSDASANQVSENANVGDSVGVTALATDADGDAVTYSLDDDAGGMFTIDANTGEVTVAGNLDYETATSHTITVRATSTDGSSSTTDMTVNVDDVTSGDTDNAVGAVSDSDASANQVSENANVGDSVGVTALATDADGDAVTYSLDDDAGGMFTIDANTGEVTVAGNLDYETATSHTITVRATSTDGSSSTGDMTVNVADATSGDTDNAVGAVSDSDASANQVSENAAVGASVGVTALATDADGDTVTYSLDDDAGGLFSIDANTGEITVAGNLDFETDQNHTVTVRATSADGSSSTADMAINVSDVNEGPSTSSQDVSTNEDVAYTFSASDFSFSDPDAGATLDHVVIVDLPVDGTLALDGVAVTAGQTIDTADIGNLTYSAPEHASGDDLASFNFKVSDGTNESDSAQFTIDVTAVADAPSLTLGSVTQSVISGSSTSSSGFEGGDIDTSQNGSEWVDSFGGWETDSDAVEVKQEILDDSSVNQFIELNDDAIDNYDDATNIYRNIETEDGGSYTLTFEFAPRPGYDASINTMEVLIDGVVVETISADGTSDTSINWQSHTLTWEGDGDPSRVEFRAAGTAVDYGRGMYLDNVEITEELPTGMAEGQTGVEIGLPSITAELTDQDGSETLATTISNIPTGLTISDGTNTFTATAGNDSVDVSGWNLNALTAEAPDGLSGTFSLQVSAIATEAENGSTATTTETSTITLKVSDFSSGPSDITVAGGTVDENAAHATVVATLSTVDADSGDSFTYELVDGSGNPVTDSNFVIVGDEIRVKTGADVDYESDQSHDLLVQVTDAGGNTYVETVTVAVNDVNETPTDITVTGAGLPGPNLIVNGSFEASDVASGDLNNYSSVSGWTASSGQIQIHDSWQGVASSDGEQHLEMDAENAVDAVYQDVQTEDGQVYTLSFDTADRGASTTDTYNVYWNGQLVATVDPASTAWEEQSFEVTGTGGTDRLEFSESSGNNDVLGGLIDNVQLRAVNDASDIVVNEDASPGTVVATLGASDPDAGETFTYTLTGDASNNFEVVGNEIRVKTGATLDYESDTAHSVTVQVTDSGGLTYEETVTIDVVDVNETASDLAFSSDDISVQGSSGDAVVTGEIVSSGGNGSVDHWSITHDGGSLVIDVLAGGFNGSSLDPEIRLFLDNGDGTFTQVAANDDGSAGSDGSTSQYDSYISQSNLTAGNYIIAISDYVADSSSMLNTASDYPVSGASSSGEYQITLTGDTVVNGIADNPAGGGSWGDPSNAATVVNSGGESIAADTVVVTSAAVDGDAGDTATYALTDDAGGAFDIDANSGEISLTGDHNVASVYTDTVTVETTDAAGNTYSEDLGIHIGTTSTVATSGTGTITQSNVTQTDSGYTVTARNVSGGSLTTASASNISNYNGTFGANGTVSATDSGMASQLAYDLASGLSEQIIVDFDNDLDSASFSFENLYTGSYGEVGHWAVYDDGVLVSEGDFTETSGGAGTVTIDPTATFDQLVLSANIQNDSSDGSDYTISNISFAEASAPIGDTIAGGAIDDVIYGLDGNDTLTGGAGDDVIVGGDDDDWIDAGDDDDWVEGGTGSDTIDTGAGDDTISYTIGHGSDTVTGGDGTDQIIISGVDGQSTDFLVEDSSTYNTRTGSNVAAGTILISAGGALIMAATDIEQIAINSGDGNDTLTVVGDFSDSALAADGLSFNGAEGSDSVDLSGLTSALDVSITSGTGNDTLDGGEGSDTYHLSGDGTANTVTDTGATGTDTIELEAGTGSNFELTDNFDAASSGVEAIDGSNVDGETLRAQMPDSQINWDFSEITMTDVDQIEGRNADDTITGSAGDDTIVGGAGDDTLTGGGGDDSLFGNDGSDLFIFRTGDGSDTVDGGVGGSWTDTLKLEDADGSEVPSGWTLNLDDGHTIAGSGADYYELSQDASGTITLADGSSVEFDNLERIEW